MVVVEGDEVEGREGGGEKVDEGRGGGSIWE